MTHYLLLLAVSPNAIASQEGASVTFTGTNFPSNVSGTLATPEGLVIAPFKTGMNGGFKVTVKYSTTNNTGLTQAVIASTAMNFISVVANVDGGLKSNVVEVFF